MVDRQWGAPTSLGLRLSLASLIQTLAVAEYLNFRHASNALGVAQSSVSARVKALEEGLDAIYIKSNKSTLLRTLVAARGEKSAGIGVHGFIPNWRRGWA